MKKSIILFLALTVCSGTFGMPDLNAFNIPPPPSHPSVPPPPPPPPPPALPGAPLPPFKVKSASFVMHPGTSIAAAPSTGCISNHDWLNIRGDNVNLATKVNVEGGPVKWERKLSSNDCNLNNCIGLYIVTNPGTPVGKRTVALTAVDGRVIRTDFQVSPATNRCDDRQMQPGGSQTLPTRGVGVSSTTYHPPASSVTPAR